MDIEKAFGRVPRKVTRWATRNKASPKVIVKIIINLYQKAKIKVRVKPESSEEFLGQVGVHQEFVLLPLIFTIVVDAITEYTQKDLMNKFCMRMTRFNK